MKQTILHLLISLFLFQFMVACDLTALEIPNAPDRVDEISTLHTPGLNCDVTESTGKSGGFVWDKQPCCSGNQESAENLPARIAFLYSPSILHPFHTSYQDICHLRL